MATYRKAVHESATTDRAGGDVKRQATPLEEFAWAVAIVIVLGAYFIFCLRYDGRPLW